jgi:CrcB protein
VALGASIGAPTRFAIDRYTIDRYGTTWPFGTFIVNSFGSFVLGLVTGLIAGTADGATEGWALISALVGVGFCGALTTFSGWTAQIVELSRGANSWRGSGYALVSLVVGLSLATCGYVLGFAIIGG